MSTQKCCCVLCVAVDNRFSPCPKEFPRTKTWGHFKSALSLHKYTKSLQKPVYHYICLPTGPSLTNISKQRSFMVAKQQSKKTTNLT